MTDRERLIDLMIDAKRTELETGSFTDYLADYLLEHGVIVPPVRVRDTVYFDNTGYHDSAEIDGIHIDENGIAFSWVQYEVGVDITELWDEGEFDIEDIGKTVFLTRKEAEQALKERDNNA